MTDSIRIAGIMRESIVDGPGIRFAIFCQGCPHDCKGCHNPETHDFKGGSDVKISKILEEIDKNSMVKGITFSGGEPMCQAEGFLKLGIELKKRDKDITIFTGYTLETLLKIGQKNKSILQLLSICDLLIDGPFIEEKKDLTLKFRGSKNQRLIDMKRTLNERKLVLFEE